MDNQKIIERIKTLYSEGKTVYLDINSKYNTVDIDEISKESFSDILQKLNLTEDIIFTKTNIGILNIISLIFILEHKFKTVKSEGIINETIDIENSDIVKNLKDSVVNLINTNNEYSDKNKKLESIITDLKDSIMNLTNTNNEYSDKNTKLESIITDLKNSNIEFENKIEELKKNIEIINTELKEKEDIISELNKKLENSDKKVEENKKATEEYIDNVKNTLTRMGDNLVNNFNVL